MKTELEYEDRASMDCACCRQDYVLLNQFGVCADCWGDLPAEKRAAQFGRDVEVVQQVVREIETVTTVYKPVSYLRVMLVGALAGALAAGVVIAAWVFGVWRE